MTLYEPLSCRSSQRSPEKEEAASIKIGQVSGIGTVTTSKKERRGPCRLSKVLQESKTVQGQVYARCQV